MTIEDYIRATRRNLTEDQTPAFYSAISASIQKLLRMNLGFRFVHSSRRECETVPLEGRIWLIYDQYLGQTFNMFNRIYFNAADPNCARMYSLKLCAEEFCSYGRHDLALWFATMYFEMERRNQSYREEADLLLRGSYTLAQEVFVILHEVVHQLVLNGPIEQQFDHISELDHRRVMEAANVYLHPDFDRRVVPVLHDPPAADILLNEMILKEPTSLGLEPSVSEAVCGPRICLGEECFCDVTAIILSRYVLADLHANAQVAPISSFICLHYLRLMSVLKTQVAEACEDRTSLGNLSIDAMNLRVWSLRRAHVFLFSPEDFRGYMKECVVAYDQYSDQLENPVYYSPIHAEFRRCVQKAIDMYSDRNASDEEVRTLVEGLLGHSPKLYEIGFGNLLRSRKSPGKSEPVALQPLDASASNRTPSIGDYVQQAMDGEMMAQLFLGLRYYLGKDCAKDFNEAVKWLEMAAMQGSENAQLCLAMIYGTGECIKYGMSPDRCLAYAWAEIASSKLPEAARIAHDLMRNKPKFVRESAMKISNDLRRRIRQAAE